MTNLEKNISIKNKLVDLFYQNQEKINLKLPKYISQTKEKAIKNFSKKGLPIVGEERYLYTDLSLPFEKEYTHQFDIEEKEGNNEVSKIPVSKLDAYTFVFENGKYSKKNELNEQSLPENIIFTSLKKAAKLYPEYFKKHYHTIANKEDSALVDLNTAFAQNGFFLFVPKHFNLDKPIQIINLLKGEKNLATTHRNLIILEESTSAKIFLYDYTDSSQAFLSNSVTEMFVGDDANFDFYNLQNINNESSLLNSIYVNQNKNSTTRLNSFILNGGFIRNNIAVELDGEYSHTDLFGLSLIDEQQHIDNFTFIDHAVPNCTSNELYKNILDNSSTVAFSGRILVRPDAQKTQAFQSNNNLLLSDTVKFYTKPQLEIYADDVKCSHGATVGQVYSDALFYLRSRGISKEEAKKILIFAFANDIVEQVHLPLLAEQYSLLIEERLNGEKGLSI